MTVLHLGFKTSELHDGSTLGRGCAPRHGQASEGIISATRQGERDLLEQEAICVFFTDTGTKKQG